MPLIIMHMQAVIRYDRLRCRHSQTLVEKSTSATKMAVAFHLAALVSLCCLIVGKRRCLKGQVTPAPQINCLSSAAVLFIHLENSATGHVTFS